MKKAALSKPWLAVAATFAPPPRAGRWPRGFAHVAAMPISAKGFTDLLLGTSPNRRATVLLHVLFWVGAYPWFALQSQWLIGEEYPDVLTLTALSRMGFAVATFYLLSVCVQRVRSKPTAVLLAVVLLGLAAVGYCLLHYYLYNFINARMPDLPGYFHKLVKSVSAQGPWTFLKSPDVLYFYGMQIVIALFLPFTIKASRVIFQAHLRSLALEKDNLKLELEFLRAQINPHLLFNTLNSVYSLVEDKDQTAAAIVLSLSNMMRYALYDSATTEVDVAQELAFIEEYLDIQQVRHQRRLTIDVQIAPELGPQRIPPLLLITFLENAVKHGVDKLLRDAWVRVQAHRDEQGTFCFAVTNAVPPHLGEAPAEGVGLQNTRRRLSLLYPNAHSLQVSHTATQYQILLRLWP